MVGSGNMGEAMLRGWMKATIESNKFYVREPNPSNWLKKMNDTKTITLNPLDKKNAVHPPPIGPAPILEIFLTSSKFKSFMLYFPLNTGCLFSTQALTPSDASSDFNILL